MTLLTNIDPWSEARLHELQSQSSLASISTLHRWQQDALAQFLQTGFPTRKNEDWKYTNVSAIADVEFEFSLVKSDKLDLDNYSMTDSYRMVFIDGAFFREKSDIDALPQGVLVSDTATMLKDEKWQPYLAVNGTCQSAFTQLNAALMSTGLFLYVEKNAVIEKPIHLLYLQTQPQRVMQHPRHMIILDQHSECCVLEEYAGLAQDYFNNIVTQIYAKQDAVLAHYKFQREAQQAKHIATTVIHQNHGSSVASHVVSMGASLSRDGLYFALTEENSSAHLYGLYLPLSHQHIDHHTRVDHLVPHCFSQQVYKGVIGMKSHAVFNGKVMVHKDAQRSSALQNNQNLLLAADAEIDTKPELEIYADDVKCTHGATIGQIDEKALFYLRSRGIEENKARHMLTQAFADEVLGFISHNNIAAYIGATVTAKIALQGAGG